MEKITFIFLEDQNHERLANMLAVEWSSKSVRLTSTGVGIVYNYALVATGRINTGNEGTTKELTPDQYLSQTDWRLVEVKIDDDVKKLPLRDKAWLPLTPKGKSRRLQIENELREQGLI